MVKFKVSKEEYEKLDDAIKALYTVNKDNADSFDLNVGDQIEGLLNAKNHEKDQKKEAQRLLDEAKKAAKEAEESKLKLEKELEEAKKNGDVESLTKSWQSKYDDLETRMNNVINAKDNFIKKTLVDNKAESLASELGVSPNALLPHIKSRLSVDFDGDEPSTKVLDAEGKISALTIEDLTTEIKGNKDLASIVKGSEAGGGGAHENGQTGTGGDGGTNGQSLEEKLDGKFQE